MAIWAIAHRGASDKAPENTLVAFERALELGADALECDVHLSADGEVMVIHDETVDRTTDGHGTVSGMTLAELQQLDAGSWKDRRFAGQRIPTLAEVTELVRGRAQLFVELRGTSPELPARVVQVLRKGGVAEQAWLFAADCPVLEELRQLAPEMHVRWREGMEAGDFVLTWPERLTAATVAVFRERGLRVFTTIRDRVGNNDARLIASRMVELGIDGIICNRVWLLREVFGSLSAPPREV
ncbi:MAG: glycerophosphodiester phosphodiesterase [Chloroflexia bacterium]